MIETGKEVDRGKMKRRREESETERKRQRRGGRDKQIE